MARSIYSKRTTGMTNIRMPKRDPGPIGRVVGAAQTALSVIGAKESGGKSLALLPGGLRGMKGMHNKPGNLASRSGANVNVMKPNQTSSSLDKLTELSNIGGMLSKAGAFGNKQDSNINETATDRKLNEMKTSLKNVSQRDALLALRDAEQTLNEYPDLAKAYKPALFNAMMIAKQRLRAGQNPYQFEGDYNASIIA